MTPPFLTYLEGQLSLSVLGPLLAARLDSDLGSLIDTTEKERKFPAIAEELNQGIAVSEDRSLIHGGTAFGRHFTLMEALNDVNSRHQRPLSILQGGAGIRPFKRMAKGSLPNAEKMAASLNLKAEGSSYETAELAAMTGGRGTVTVVEWDERILAAVHESVDAGMIVDKSQAMSLTAGRIGAMNFIRGDGETRALYGQWESYLWSFADQVARKVTPVDEFTHRGVAHEVGLILHPQPFLREAVRGIRHDIATWPFNGRFDLIWLANIHYYLDSPLWWALLVRAISSLPIAGSKNPAGGLLVTDRFTQRPPYADSDADDLDSFWDLCGMKAVAEVSAPLERRPPLVIAKRERPSDWIDKQMRRMKPLGLVAG